jgi:hypothetical protein
VRLGETRLDPLGSTKRTKGLLRPSAGESEEPCGVLEDQLSERKATRSQAAPRTLEVMLGLLEPPDPHERGPGYGQTRRGDKVQSPSVLVGYRDRLLGSRLRTTDIGRSLSLAPIASQPRLINSR